MIPTVTPVASLPPLTNGEVLPGSGLLGEPFTEAAERLLQQGWCVLDQALPAHLVSALAAEARAGFQGGDFRPAGVGRGASLRLRPDVRTDWVQWLDPATASPAQRAYLEQMAQLRETVNRVLTLGLFDFEGHLAVYPPGSYYRKHLDQFQGVGRRTLTCVGYLNPDWEAADGGELRLYTDPSHPERYQAILPAGGRLVLFLSAEFLHEVLPARRPRLSLTGWFRRRP
jgi:SM-20-related protein